MTWSEFSIRHGPVLAEAMNEAYEAKAVHIGARSFTRTWRVKLTVLAVC